MHATDLLFLAAVLATLLALVSVAWRVVRAQRGDAQRLARFWVIGAATYIAVLIVVSLIQPARVVPLGEDECFDDWCIAVVAANIRAEHTAVSVRVSNRGRGRQQAEPDAYVYLRDERGIDVQSLPGEVTSSTGGIGDAVAAGASRMVRVEFATPDSLDHPALVKARRSRFPSTLIIGDPDSWLHKRTVHALTLPPVR